MPTSAACTTIWGRRISDYHDGGLSSTERAETEEHIRVCVQCQATLQAHDRLYRGLRATPGFEGMLTLTRPGTRRGMGAAQRPMFSWPGRTLGAAPARRGGGLSTVVVVLVLAVIAGSAIFAGHIVVSYGPSATRGASSVSAPSPTPTFTPPLGNLTPNGTACANAGTTYPASYAFANTAGSISIVTGCDNPIQLTRLSGGPWQIDGWSPDGSTLAVQSLQDGALAVIDRSSGVVRPVNLGGAVTSPARADEAVWASTGLLIVRSGQSLLEVDLVSRTVTPLNVSRVTHIEWRADALYYSVSATGATIVHQRDVATNADAVVATLADNLGGCAATSQGCAVAPAWDVSPDGTFILYQAPSLANAAQTLLQYSQVANGTPVSAPKTLLTLPYSGAPIALELSPNGTKLAIATPGDGAQAGSVMIFDIPGQTSVTLAGQVSFAWRYDSQALVIEPDAPTSGATPRLYDLVTKQSLQLPVGTASYFWQQS